MAPFSISMSAMLQSSLNELKQRSLGNSTSATPRLSLGKERNLQILAVTFSSISVASAILAFYWFVNMRRSFRHHLIMLLIQSDMFKALWFLIYPIVVFTHGEPGRTSVFCQVNGFFIAFGNEASDFAILMIAIHSALYIFRPVATAGEGGLYPYRRIAYVLWVILPLLASSLAFIDGPDVYQPQGTYCYLPVRPFWFRLALSWIPRYAIFVLIFIIYAAIYFYVRYKFHSFNKKSPSKSSLYQSDRRDSIQLMQLKAYALPTTPSLAYNGLIAESRSNSLSENRATPPSRSISISSRGSLNHPGDAVIDITSSFYIEPMTITPQDRLAYIGEFENSTAIGSFPNTTDSFGEQDLQHAEESKSPRPFSTASTLICKSSSPFKAFFSHTFSRSSPIISKFPQPPVGPPNNHPENTPTGIISDLELIDTQGKNMMVSELEKTREKIRKQLRFLFIYPLVYIAMWLVPFINHVLQYNDTLAADPPYGLRCATVIFVTLQCAVDCWLFSTRERPWRHIPSNDGGTFWGSFTLWRGAQGRSTYSGARCLTGPGKSRVELVAEARMAYKRREDETETWKKNDLERRRMRARVEGDGVQFMRNWWDSGFDGSSMSPVAEEIDFLDNGTTSNGRIKETVLTTRNPIISNQITKQKPTYQRTK